MVIVGRLMYPMISIAVRIHTQGRELEIEDRIVYGCMGQTGICVISKASVFRVCVAFRVGEPHMLFVS